MQKRPLGDEISYKCPDCGITEMEPDFLETELIPKSSREASEILHRHGWTDEDIEKFQGKCREIVNTMLKELEDEQA